MIQSGMQSAAALLALLLGACTVEGAGPAAATPQTVLAVFAHPDDDTIIGPVLTSFAARGAAVHVVYVTDGRFGVRDHAGVPAGDELASLRQEEARCGARARGSEPPVFLGFTDQLASGAIGEQVQRLGDAAGRIGAEIDRVSPDLVITFGPGGDTGHPDHRLVGDLTTQAMLSRSGGAQLWQFGWPQSQAAALVAAGIPLIAYRDNAFDATESFSEAEETKEEEAVRCYASQFTPEEMKQFIAAEKAETSNTRSFRTIALSH